MPQEKNISVENSVPELENGHKRIFVYGSLRKGLYNCGRCGEQKFITIGQLKDYGLYSLGYYPAIIKGKGNGNGVVGEVYDVDEVTFRSLNGMEIGAGYNQIEGEVELSTGEVINVIFWDMDWEKFANYQKNPESLLVVDGDWVRHEKEKDN